MKRLIAEPIKPAYKSEDLYKQFLDNVYEALCKAEKGLIKKVAEDIGVDERCAKHFLYEHFNVHIERENDTGIVGTGSFVLVAELKSVEEILERSESRVYDAECLKQLLED